ncbi:T9SS type A sorting domain-containing protein [Vicingus serpentipes]|uniref:T9SS type A sorting domain-containing protein n=1 Tax=Vicingus serpentipes TaxID=1926625 RepID=A0A5C6RW14_9FLAO|nr:T9SS type A sorting domain-containing protein [Vicingus serpentipes]TXB66746.1 T9SS type A sorting domain-containing protein [Vicingus serpentipes]
MKNNILYIIIFILTPFFVFSQKDTLLELGVNKKIINERFKEANNEVSLLRKKNNSSSYKKASSLPFFDDFSQQEYYPDASKWMDNAVYINSNYAVNPISYGVATFDGLDSTGYPYNFINSTAQGVADYLTSKPIDLTTPTDSVYLSFFYQPQGIGNKPETSDSLKVEFFRLSDSTWVRKWAAGGSALQPFKQVMIAVDTSFHKANFQFRFKNYATLSGNVDHWNVDYVYLNDNRNYLDTTINDVALTGNFYNFLNEYTRMPWQHYIIDTIGFMASAIDVAYRNNTSSPFGVFYRYNVISDNGSGSLIEDYPPPGSNKNVFPYSTLIEPQAVYDLGTNDFSFPFDAAATSKVFQVKNYFNLGGLPDDHQENDTVVSYQVFGNDYAYDDGSAEVGYGVQGIGSKLAHQFSIKKSDTLTSLKMYFSPITNNMSAKTFKLTIWSNLSPETVIYQQNAYYSPIYSNTNEFLEYLLDAPLYLPAGTYYVGYEKISEDFLNLGWDLNTNNSNKVFFNAVGIWQNATVNGSLMVRPVFGAYPDPVISIKEHNNYLNDINIYPNPTSSNLYFKANTPYTIDITDMYGKLIESYTESTNKIIDVSFLKNGIYLFKFSNNKSSITKKIIISK